MINQLVTLCLDDPDVQYESGRFFGKRSSELYLHLMKVAPHSARVLEVTADGTAAEGIGRRRSQFTAKS